MASVDATLQEIFRMKRDAGIRRVSSCFQCTEFGGDENGQYLHAEFVYEVVMHAMRRGLPGSSVGPAAHVIKDLLPKLKGLKTSDVVQLIRDELSQTEPRLTPGHQAVLLDFILKTYVPHQRLYQAFLNGDTGLTHITSELEIEGPSHPLPLCEGTDAVELDQQQLLKELQFTQSQKEAEILELKEKMEAQVMAKLQANLNDLPLEGNMSREEVEEVLRGLLQSQGQMIMECLMKEVHLTNNLLHLKLLQKSQLTEQRFTNAPVSTQQHCVPTATKNKNTFD